MNTYTMIIDQAQLDLIRRALEEMAVRNGKHAEAADDMLELMADMEACEAAHPGSEHAMAE